MAEISWSRAHSRRAETAERSAWQHTLGRIPDWEDVLTLVLALAATITVSYGLESSGWSSNMPDLAIVSIVALVVAMFLARSSMTVFAAWPLGIVLGALVTLWQTLVAVGPGALDTRFVAIYERFNTWFHIAFTGGVSNDSLPFNTLIVGLTWLGVFLFGWSVFRWHHAWLGLIPGGAALFIGLVFVSDSLSTAVAIYVLFGFLLVMRTNLTKSIADWRKRNMSYPPMISLSFLHFTTWALLALLIAAWIVPVGPYATPAFVDSTVRRLEGIGIDFVRLAGPLHVSKVVPAHNYTGVLPFQGSVDLGERELFMVRVEDPTIAGPIALRGTVYENYGSGGWTAGERERIELAEGIDETIASSLSESIEEGELNGLLVPLEITMEAKSVVGTVMFSPGQSIGADPSPEVEVPQGSLARLPVEALLDDDPVLINGGRDLSDRAIIERFVPEWFTGISVTRDEEGRVAYIEGFDNRGRALADVAALHPDSRVPSGDSYSVTGFVPDVTPNELRNAGDAYPVWVRAQYLGLPDSLPERVTDLAASLAAAEETAYDKATVIETYLRENYPVDYNLGETPAGRDTVDFFLFDARRGFFDYHASAMTVMLRGVDVPARLAVGFVFEDSDITASGTYMVRDRNAYAWTEVYFPGYGWIPFNPSPDRPADLTPTEREEGLIGDINGDTVIDINDFPGLPVGADPIFGADDFESLGDFGLQDPFPEQRSQGVSRSTTDYTQWVLIGFAAVAAMIAASAALGWRRSVSGLPFADATWEKTVRLASLAGVGPQPGQTPNEFARSLQREFRDQPVIKSISEAYVTSRFGRREVHETEQRYIQRHWPHLRSAMMGRVFSRLLKRRNPRG